MHRGAVWPQIPGLFGHPARRRVARQIPGPGRVRADTAPRQTALKNPMIYRGGCGEITLPPQAHTVSALLHPAGAALPIGRSDSHRQPCRGGVVGLSRENRARHYNKFTLGPHWTDAATEVRVGTQRGGDHREPLQTLDRHNKRAHAASETSASS